MEWEECFNSAPMIRRLKQNGMQSPTHIQHHVLPLACSQQRDLIVAAQTGSGKTLCFGIPLILSLKPEEGIQSLIISPTRELCMQIKSHISAININSARLVTIIGGLSKEKQQRLLNKNPHIIIATPGRLWEFIQENSLKSLKSIKLLVIDEADRMIESGHFKELSSILNYIYSPTADTEFMPSDIIDLNFGDDIDIDELAQKGFFKQEKERKAVKIQTILASATLTVDNKIRKNLYKSSKKKNETILDKLLERIQFRGKPKIVDLTAKEQMPSTLTHYKMKCTDEEKTPLLHYILSQNKDQKTIVFCNAVHTTKRLARALRTLNYSVSKLEGKMNQKHRIQKLERFASNNNILVATDVACRGLDLPEVKLVLHYHMPVNAETYVHRCGRTARIHNTGTSIAFVSPNDIKQLKTIQSLLNNEFTNYPVDLRLFNFVKDNAETAEEIADLEMKREKGTKYNAWIEKTSQSTGLEFEDRSDIKGKKQIQRLRKSLQSEELPLKRTSVITPELYELAKKQKLI